jgi:hypothetical protein
MPSESPNFTTSSLRVATSAGPADADPVPIRAGNSVLPVCRLYRPVPPPAAVETGDPEVEVAVYRTASIDSSSQREARRS